MIVTSFKYSDLGNVSIIQVIAKIKRTEYVYERIDEQANKGTYQEKMYANGSLVYATYLLKTATNFEHYQHLSPLSEYAIQLYNLTKQLKSK